MSRTLLPLALLSLVGCFPETRKDAETVLPSESDADTDADTDTDTDADTDTDTDTDTDADTDTDTDTIADYTTIRGAILRGIRAGSFSMGSSASGPVHDVTLTHDFWLGRTEVTQSEWLAVMGTEPSEHRGCSACPVEDITWVSAAKYTNALSVMEGLDACYSADGRELAALLAGNPYDCDGYRLPTEAEWEYAARAGESYTYAGSDTVELVGWIDSNSGGTTHDVATLDANAWGLHDMSGNVFEFVNDGYEAYDAGSETDPVGGRPGSAVVVRGGSWANASSSATVTYRFSGDPTSERYSNLGFRVARSSLAP